MIRSFVAIDLPTPTKTALQDVAEQLRRQAPPDSVRWTRVEGIHLTLQFLGDVAEADLPHVKTALAEVGLQHAPFTLTIGGMGCFPNARRPGVVWVGVQEESGALAALQRAIEKSLKPLGFEPERRAFHPHLTLGRTRKGIHSSDQYRLGEIIAAARVGELAQVHATSFRLMRSDLRPDGATYTVLAEFPLGKSRPRRDAI
jgi:2'-5' RNA ligase